jgi:hypothetical protein
VSKVTVKLEYEKATKNSVRYKEIPEPGKAPVLGTLYVQNWFAEGCKSLEITVEKKD